MHIELVFRTVVLNFIDGIQLVIYTFCAPQTAQTLIVKTLSDLQVFLVLVQDRYII